ncbi:hypothetical protein JVU11DRAFT_4780 [Chiua virens]|nr:hypothetical protein JVU11DRAFT_4780 [Chiua virens]
MSQVEDDRAAKAARAKAMLKKRQKTAVAGSRSASLASPPPSRSYTPVPGPAEDGKRERDINDLFNANDADANWIESLPRAEVPDVNVIVQPKPQSPGRLPRSPPPLQERVGTPASPSPPVATLANPPVLDDLHTQLAEQRQIIASLQSQNSTLRTSLSRLDEIQTDARDKTQTLRWNLSLVVTRRLEELSREKSRLENLHSAAQTKTGDLEASRLELDRRLSDASQKVDSLQHDLERLALDLRSARQEVHDSRAHSTEVEQELSAARGQIEELRANAVANAQEWQEQDHSRQQTISLLVSEKASLTASLQRLEEIEIEFQERENSHLAEQAKTGHLTKRVQELEATTRTQGSELQQAFSREKELLERVRDQEREIQLRKVELEEVQAASNQHQQRVRELEEQIETDDRADKLEISLKNTQDRADELEFQFNKIQQSHATIKTEKVNLESQLRLKTESEADWKARHTSLEADHAMLQGHLNSTKAAVKQLQQKLGELASDVTSSDRTLQNTQGELRTALRRAEGSEKTQKDLQAEGTRLMQSLEEMRPKIVELTSVKVELMEQIEKLEHEKRSRDTLISRLEIALSEGTEREAEAAKLRKESDMLREKDKHSLQQSVADLQRGYSLLEAELQSAQATVKTFETERTRMRQTEVRQADLGNRMTAEARRREEEISQLESVLASSRKNEADQSQLIVHYRTEIEVLQSELVAKEEELESVQKTPSAPEDGLRSLDDEMLSALKQQHAIELSSSQSQIRALETAVFEAQDKAHRFQRQIHILEDQLAPRSVSRATARPFSPGGRPSSRTSNDYAAWIVDRQVEQSCAVHTIRLRRRTFAGNTSQASSQPEHAESPDRK